MRYWGKSLHHQNLLNRLWLHLLAFILHLSFSSPKSLLTLSCILFSALINPFFSLLSLSFDSFHFIDLLSQYFVKKWHQTVSVALIDGVRFSNISPICCSLYGNALAFSKSAYRAFCILCLTASEYFGTMSMVYKTGVYKSNRFLGLLCWFFRHKIASRLPPHYVKIQKYQNNNVLL